LAKAKGKSMNGMKKDAKAGGKAGGKVEKRTQRASVLHQRLVQLEKLLRQK